MYPVVGAGACATGEFGLPEREGTAGTFGIAAGATAWEEGGVRRLAVGEGVDAGRLAAVEGAGAERLAAGEGLGAERLAACEEDDVEGLAAREVNGAGSLIVGKGDGRENRTVGKGDGKENLAVGKGAAGLAGCEEADGAEDAWGMGTGIYTRSRTVGA